MSYNWVAPCKPARCDYFVAIFQVAQNRLKFGMSTPFVLKHVPVFFFKNAEKYGQSCVKFNATPPPPPLCPSPNNIGFRSLRAKTLCVCLLRYWREVLGGGGGARRAGGGLSRMCLKPCFPTCERNRRDIFSQKRSRHAKFQQILSNLENRYKIQSHRAGLHGALQSVSLKNTYELQVHWNEWQVRII